MDLFLTIDHPSGRHDVTVELEHDHTVRELLEALEPGVGIIPDVMTVRSLRTGRTLQLDEAVFDADVLSGDELAIGSGDRRHATADVEPSPQRAVTLDITAGPDAGRSVLLRPGRHHVGRGADVDISIDDRSVSRNHLTVVVDQWWKVSIDPTPDAANGVTVNDVDIEGPHAVGGDDVVGLGGTRLVVRPFRRSGDEHVDLLGQIDFHRTPYRPPIVEPRANPPLGPIPRRPEPRRLQLLAVVAPLAAGVAMYAFTRQVQFLALTLISPVVMIGNAIDERRSGRRNFRREVAMFRNRLVRERQRLDGLRHDERLERLRAAPDLADLLRRAELRTVDLWPRGRTAPDVLVMRLGLGSSTVHHTVEIEPGGADDLRDEARDAIAGLDRIDNVPVTVDLCIDSILGIHGDRVIVDGVLGSIVVQAATLHSPDDVTIAAALAPDRPLGWLKWLPHVRSVASPLTGAHVVTTTDDADRLLQRLIEVAGFRTTDDHHQQRDRRWPRILLLLDAGLDLDPVLVARLLVLAPTAGISVVWATSTVAGVPRHATRTLQVRRHTGDAMVGRLWSTDPSVPEQHCEVEHLRPALAERAARSLAPVRDASTASAATSIPRVAPLLDVLGVGCPTGDWVSEQWRTDRADGLVFPIGLGAEGPVELDLVHDGPHALVGGTSGSGKSELLQSMVATMAARHPPSRLNFLFVDYKGGASSGVFGRLPHTVGHVTNLGPDLALRALTSLRAELRHRMEVLEGRAQDLTELRRIAPDEAPPALVIVVDEFATLVKEVPGFVDGIVDIAQRGRSLGIHLVLATQRPAGAVNENILANTNLRIGLRMLDRSDSSSVIDSPAAADIPVPLRGRGLVRCGPRHLIEFQGAHAGAAMAGVEAHRRVRVRPFGSIDASHGAVVEDTGADTATQLSVLLDAIGAAAAQQRLPTPRRPWRDVLPGVVTLDSILADPQSDAARIEPGRFVPIGMVDVPEQQLQRPAVVDLETGGGLLVFGSGGTGTTTLLRTIATAIDRCAGHGDVATIVFDFASRGLTALRDLPTVIDVASGDDLESVTRHLLCLDGELGRRGRLLADAGAEDVGSYNLDALACSGEILPRVVVLIDGFEGLASALFEPASGMGVMSAEVWSDLISRLVLDGRRVGIHTVVAADRRHAVPARVHAAVGNRVVLRHADPSSYADLGVSLAAAAALDSTPGRALLDGATLLQVACVAGGATSREQAIAVAETAATSRATPATVLSSRPLPTHVSLESVADRLGPQHPAAAPVPTFVLGVVDITGSAAVVDLEWSSLTVTGPPRSGRSTALATAAIQLREHHDVWVFGPLASPLSRMGFDHGAFGRPADIAPVLERLVEGAARAATGDVIVVVVDDVDAFDHPVANALLERLIMIDAVRLIGALEHRSMTGYTASPVVSAMRRARRLLVLRPDDPSEFVQTTGIKLPSRPGLRQAPGRGVLLVDRIPTLVQVVVARPDPRDALVSGLLAARH